jgi:hypothetical protein
MFYKIPLMENALTLVNYMISLKSEINHRKSTEEKFAIFHNRPFWIENIKGHKAEDKTTKGN